jgi:phosphoribosylamine--glycine ligase
LLHTLHRDAPNTDFFITGASGGTAELATSIAVSVGDSAGVADWAAQRAIDLVVVGPEAPLADGMVDRLMERGVAAFGPVAAAARIEASKAYAKALMQRAGVPTARHATFSAADAAEQYVRSKGAPIVVKASGLAAGKGAVVCDSVDEAVATIHSMLRAGDFGQAGAKVVVEECMVGEEISYFALTDGTHALLMPGVQDHKRIGEGDTGLNTGGMGAYAPVSIDTSALREIVLSDIIAPTLAALRADHAPFRGLLYAGLMLTADGPRVVEFNCRFGDPETQALLPLLRSSLLEPMQEIARGGTIRGHNLEWAEAAALTTVLASRGYPAGAEQGQPITIPREVTLDARITIFHAATRRDGHRLLTDGGRVLDVTAVATSLEDAANLSRTAAETIRFEGKQYRRDIGWRELARQDSAHASRR